MVETHQAYGETGDLWLLRFAGSEPLNYLEEEYVVIATHELQGGCDCMLCFSLVLHQGNFGFQG